MTSLSINSLTFSIMEGNPILTKNMLKKINSNIRIKKGKLIGDLYIFEIERLKNINGHGSNIISNILISLIKGFDINDDIFMNPKLEPLGYYIYYELSKNINSGNNTKRYQIKYGLENILADINYVTLNRNVYFKGYQNYLRIKEPSTDIKKIYLNKAKFDLFYENLLTKYSEYNTIKNNVGELEQIYKILYLIYYNKSLSKYYKEKISNILNIHKSLFVNPIKQSFGSIVNLDSLKSDLIDTHKGIGKNKQLTGTVK